MPADRSRMSAGRKSWTFGALRADVLASIAVVALEVPQGMAYALLAGLPPVTGLLVSIAAPIGYAAVVRDRHLSVGPVALVCLLIAGGLHSLAEPGTERYGELATALSLEVGVLLLALGLLRAGFVANFLGHPATVGFNAAAALLTAASQLPALFGLRREVMVDYTAENPWPALLHLHEAQGLPLALGVGTLLVVILLPRVQRRVPAALVACVLGGIVTGAFGLHTSGLATVGDLPRGLPLPHIPEVSWSDLRALVPTALSIAVVSYGGSIALAKSFAARNRERVEPDRVLVGLGAANLAATVIGGFPVSASLSRSQLLEQAGARTRLPGLLVAVWVGLCMFALSPAFRVLPLAVLAGIIIHSVLGLFDAAEARAIWRTHARDGATMLLTFVATLVWGLIEGLAVGLLVALVLVVARTAAPHTAELGRIPGTLVYRNTHRFQVQTCPQAGILRVDAPLYFANARFLEDRIHRMFAERPDMRVLVLDCSGIGDLDATGVQTLRNLVGTLRARGNDLHLVGPIGPVRDLLARTGVDRLLGADNIHRTLPEAAPGIMARVSRAYCEQSCRASAFAGCAEIPRESPATEASRAARFTPQI